MSRYRIMENQIMEVLLHDMNQSSAENTNKTQKKKWVVLLILIKTETIEVPKAEPWIIFAWLHHTGRLVMHRLLDGYLISLGAAGRWRLRTLTNTHRAPIMRRRGALSNRRFQSKLTEELVWRKAYGMYGLRRRSSYCTLKDVSNQALYNTTSPFATALYVLYYSSENYSQLFIVRYWKHQVLEHKISANSMVPRQRWF